MKNNILKTLSNNWVLKILSVFFAFTLWLMVYNLEDPTKTKTLTVNVAIENRESIEDMGKYYEVIEGSNKASFSITAVRSVLDKLDETDFVATADMNQIVIDEATGIGTVPIEIACTSNVNQNSYKLSSTSKNMRVMLEDLMVKQFVVTAKTEGAVAEGYALGSVEVTAPNVLKVSGPKSIVQTIASAVAVIDVTDMSEAETTYQPAPILYDKDGNEVDITRLTLSHSRVNVSAEILNTKEVDIVVSPVGTPAEGYTVTAINTNPATIVLKGSKSVLNGINSIEIPESLISVEGKDKDVTATIDVSEYIPKDVTLVNPESSSVEITVSIGRIREKVFSINSENIIVNGLSTGTELKFDLSTIAVHVSGLEEDIAQLSNETLKGSIDVTYLPIGIHEVELLLDLDESKYTYKTIKVTVYITDVTMEDVETGAESSSEDTSENTSEDASEENSEGSSEGDSEDGPGNENSETGEE